MPKLQNVSKEDSNPGCLDCESGILQLTYQWGGWFLVYNYILLGDPSNPSIIWTRSLEINISSTSPTSLPLPVFMENKKCTKLHDLQSTT